MSVPSEGATLFDMSSSMGMMYTSVDKATLFKSNILGTKIKLFEAFRKYTGDAETDLRDVQSIEAAVKTIYKDVQRILQDILYLKRHINLLHSYSSLPGEILFSWRSSAGVQRKGGQ